ncbi:hypothetical protein ABR737_00435 [Streptomyces sp. Edi2]|uniref:hypothetical protein n=1 Tax=Streptomyces sp. Edi2 TaxID=3162528 RepID=UPI00330575D0
MTTHSPAAPAAPATSCPVGPRPCYWVEETDGSRWMVPGCLARALDPDAGSCTCLPLHEQLEAMRAELAAAHGAYAGLRHWHDQVLAAVHGHVDGRRIMREAARVM